MVGRRRRTGPWRAIREVEAGGGRPFEGADDRRPDRDDRAPLALRGGEGVERRRRDAEALFVHRVVVEILGGHRGKRAEADVEGDGDDGRFLSNLL